MEDACLVTHGAGMVPDIPDTLDQPWIYRTYTVD